jgi:hypothetical protein
MSAAEGVAITQIPSCSKHASNSPRAQAEISSLSRGHYAHRAQRLDPLDPLRQTARDARAPDQKCLLDARGRETTRLLRPLTTASLSGDGHDHASRDFIVRFAVLLRFAGSLAAHRSLITIHHSLSAVKLIRLPRRSFSEGGSALGPDVMEDESGDDQTKKDSNNTVTDVIEICIRRIPLKDAVEKSEGDLQPGITDSFASRPAMAEVKQPGQRAMRSFPCAAGGTRSRARPRLPMKW